MLVRKLLWSNTVLTIAPLLSHLLNMQESLIQELMQYASYKTYLLSNTSKGYDYYVKAEHIELRCFLHILFQ